MDAIAGVTEIEIKVAADTVKVVVPLTPLNMADMVVDPGVTVVVTCPVF